MYSMSCPKCGKKIKLITFGNAWIGMCNSEIVYNSCRLPRDIEARVKNYAIKGVRSDSPSPSPTPIS
jgi:hypothetical protein